MVREEPPETLGIGRRQEAGGHEVAVGTGALRTGSEFVHVQYPGILVRILGRTGCGAPWTAREGP
jgi:hypothetical protein